MRRLALPFLFAFPISAAVSINFIGATPTQAIIAIRGCYDDITLNGLTPSVNDWDQTKFINANKASGHSNTVGLNTGYTILTIGQRTAKVADDFTAFDPAVEPKGAYSLALQAFTQYSGTVTCTAGSANFSFMTANIPWGAGRREPWQQDGAGGILREGGDDFIDHVTGVRHQRFIGRMDQIVGNWPTKADHDAGVLDYTGDQTFNPPSGSGWTNPQNVFGISGEATTTGNGWLFTGWGGGIISDSVGLAVNRGDIAWINASVTGNCTDTGDGSCASGGNLMDMCLTMDGVKCATRISRFALSPTATQTWVCGPEHTNADTTGCLPANRGLPDSWSGISMWSAFQFYANSTTSLWNAGSNITASFFGGSSECLQLHPTDQIGIWTQGQNVVGVKTIASLACGANPPTVTFTSAIDLSFNGSAGSPAADGTVGAPFYFARGMQGNTRAGFLIRKSAGACANCGAAKPNATTHISRVGRSGGTYFHFIGPDGGHQQVAQPVSTPAGYYPFFNLQNGALYGEKMNADGTVSAKFYGSSNCSGGTDFLWDQYIPGRFYCNGEPGGSDTQRVIYRTDLWSQANSANNAGMIDKACGEVGSGCTGAGPNGAAANWGSDQGGRLPVAPQGSAFTGQGYYRLNPDLQHSAVNYSIQAQLDNLSPGASIFGGGAGAFVVDHTLLGSASMGAQDSICLLWAFDLGNGLPIDNGYLQTPGYPGRPSINGFPQQIYAIARPYAQGPGRWGGCHTLQNNNGGPNVVFVDEGSDGSHDGLGQAFGVNLVSATLGGITTSNIPACYAGAGAPNGPNCDVCPAATISSGNDTNNNPYTDAGNAKCTSIVVQSATGQANGDWNPAWGSQPAAWIHGDPVSNANSATNNGYHYLQHAMPGDYAVINRGPGSEALRIIQMTDATHWIVQRAIGFGFNGIANAANSLIFLQPSTTPNAPDPLGGNMMWFPTLTTDGSNPNYFFPTSIGNHAFYRQGGASYGLGQFAAYFMYKQGANAPLSLKARVNSGAADVNIWRNVGTPPVALHFSGKTYGVSGANIENHPSCGQNYNAATDYEWCGGSLKGGAFIDESVVVNPLGMAGTPLPCSVAANCGNGTVIPGNLWKIAASPSGPDPDGLNTKHFPTFVLSQTRNLTNKSGPGSVITGGSSDLNTFCIAEKAGECVAGSAPGDAFANAGLIDPQLKGAACAGGQTGVKGFCAQDSGALFGFTNQIRVPSVIGTSAATIPFGPNFRNISSKSMNGGLTENTRLTPDARFVIEGDLMGIMPPIPADDNIDRTEFIPFTVNLKPPAGLGVDNAIVIFGYNLLIGGAQDLFYCSENRPERCVANSTAINRANPFLWPSVDGAGGVEAGIAGVSCAAGCTVVAPAISQKVIYYKWKYRDATGKVLAESQVQVAAAR